VLKNASTAKQINDLMLDISGRLEESVVNVKETCAPAEFEEYRRSVARILGQVLLGVLNPLYLEHPSLRPPGFK
jgi:hypothetical protein